MTSISVNDLQPRERIASLVGVSIALLVPAYLSAGNLGLSLVAPTAPSATLINELAIWTVILVLLGIVLFWERYSLKSIGLDRPTWETICMGALCTAPLLLLSMITGRILQVFGAPANDNGQAMMIMTLPFWLQLFIAVTAGFTEEVLFRGYAIERITLLTGSKWIGACLPIITFGAAHAPFWGLPHAVIAGMTGFWLTLIYLWQRNLWVNITAHALLDAVLFIGMDLHAASGLTH